MPFPFEFYLETLPPFATVYDLQEICRDETYSFAGILIKMKRNSVGQLLCGYYYPTTSFALLSMISYLIKPEKVSHLDNWNSDQNSSKKNSLIPQPSSIEVMKS